MSSNPLFTDIPEGQWVKVSSGLKKFTIWRKKYDPDKHLYTYRISGNDPPTSQDEGVPIFVFQNQDYLERSYDFIVDAYIWTQGGDGKVVVHEGLNGNTDVVNQKTAFGELSVAEFEPLTAWAFTHNINPGIIKQTINTTGTIINTGCCAVLNTGSDSAGSAKIETIRSSRYIPGVGAVARFTCRFSIPQENSIQLVGIGNGTDGWFFGYDGLRFGIMRRKLGVDTWYYQEDWTDDIKPELDTNKGNVYQIKYQWLGYGMQYFYIENDEGELSLVHRIRYANLFESPSIANPNLPLSAYAANIGNTTPLELSTPSAMAGVEGDAFNDSLSVNLADDASFSSPTAFGTNFPVIAFRLTDTYLGKANRLFVQVLTAVFSTDCTKPVTFRTYANPVINDGTWAYVNEQLSPIEVNKTITSIDLTNAVQIGTFPLSKTDSLSLPITEAKFRFYAGQTIIIVATSTGSGDITAGANFRSFI